MSVTRGRGAPGNQTSQRFSLPERAADGDWLDIAQDVDGDPPRLRTSVMVEQPRTIISRNTSPDIGFNQSVNAYRGCELEMRSQTNLFTTGDLRKIMLAIFQHFSK